MERKTGTENGLFLSCPCYWKHSSKWPTPGSGRELLQEGDCQIICYLQFLNIKQGEVGTSEKNFSWEFLESLANIQQLLIQNPLKWHAKSVCVCVVCAYMFVCDFTWGASKALIRFFKRFVACPGLLKKGDLLHSIANSLNVTAEFQDSDPSGLHLFLWAPQAKSIIKDKILPHWWQESMKAATRTHAKLQKVAGWMDVAERPDNEAKPAWEDVPRALLQTARCHGLSELSP